MIIYMIIYYNYDPMVSCGSTIIFAKYLGMDGHTSSNTIRMLFPHKVFICPSPPWNEVYFPCAFLSSLSYNHFLFLHIFPKSDWNLFRVESIYCLFCTL